tara:strand:+ start:859 stop:1164 length:306 start_codon:yes stop_codon:yes gene_type:complete
MSKKLEIFIEKATDNITEDRAATKTLLMTLMKYMTVSEDRHKEVGLIAAKYLETLQRSNEQLVKLAALVQKDITKDQSISDQDKQDLFDMISKSENQEENS